VAKDTPKAVVGNLIEAYLKLLLALAKVIVDASIEVQVCLEVSIKG
jgi:hypothetical protein